MGVSEGCKWVSEMVNGCQRWKVDIRSGKWISGGSKWMYDIANGYRDVVN